MKSARLYRLAPLVALILALVGCSDGGSGGGGAGADAPGEPVTVRINQGSDVLSMDPYLQHESPTMCVLRNVFDTLTDYDRRIELQPCLAESWTNDGDRVWTFKLKEGVTFHGGQPFTAEDAAFSLDRALNWEKSRTRSEIQTIEAVEAIDPLTLRITTRLPDAILPLRLASVLIMDQESTEQALAEHGEAWLASHANGTGAYRVAEWIKDAQCVLERFDGYWGEPPVVERLVFIPTSQDATRMVNLQRGGVDLVVNVPPTQVKQVEALPGYRTIKSPSLRLIYLGLDVGRDESPRIPGSPPNPLKDARVRQAIMKSIDNKAIVESIMGGNAEPIDQLLPPGVTGHDPSIQLERPDYEEARRLLAEAGYPDGFTVRLDGPNDRYVNDARIISAVAQELARCGIQVEPNAVPKARFFSEEQQGNCSFFLIGWSNTNGDGQGTFDHLLHTPDPENNLGVANASTNYSNPRLDEICRQATVEFDPARREALLREANRLAIADLPHIPLHLQMDIYAIADRLDWTPRRDTQVRGVDIRLAAAP
ncbi:MAG TPA: ABC transporter substrate-binding protein [Candidatus Sumerlaeota bacterium]|nr:ABC transporter substrate-binding protein [Candidatus Sumerlaeota bacterium]